MRNERVCSKQFRLTEDGFLHLVDEVVPREPGQREPYTDEKPPVSLLPVVRDLCTPVAEPEPEEHAGVSQEHEDALVDRLVREVRVEREVPIAVRDEGKGVLKYVVEPAADDEYAEQDDGPREDVGGYPELADAAYGFLLLCLALLLRRLRCLQRKPMEALNIILFLVHRKMKFINRRRRISLS